MIKVSSPGDFNNTREFLKRIISGKIYSDLERYGQMGVDALARATPVRTGLAASSWTYRIIKGHKPTIEWLNYDVEGGDNVAILIQYGHGTGTGGYVEGTDFINPAMHALFNEIANEVWKKVTA